MVKNFIKLQPIGFVRCRKEGKDVRDRHRVVDIILREDLTESLDGIDGFSHIFVISWLHQISLKERNMKKVHPRGRVDTPLLGVFSTRTPFRPNPIGMTLVELLKIHDNILTVRGLDAYDNTPVLDIKPFDYWDTAKDARVPDWWLRLQKDRPDKTLF